MNTLTLGVSSDQSLFQLFSLNKDTHAILDSRMIVLATYFCSFC